MVGALRTFSAMGPWKKDSAEAKEINTMHNFQNLTIFEFKHL
jgi:hypothetical protein